jgi:hypothetical protein
MTNEGFAARPPLITVHRYLQRPEKTDLVSLPWRFATGSVEPERLGRGIKSIAFLNYSFAIHHTSLQGHSIKGLLTPDNLFIFNLYIAFHPEELNRSNSLIIHESIFSCHSDGGVYEKIYYYMS